MRSVARTAVVAGTATAVSGRVARRQGNRWNQQAEAEAYEQMQQAPPQQPAAAPQEDTVSQLKELAELKDAGILTEEEFAAQKAKILGS
jgi:membrane protease subunit (stomatin/prohibitin family)